MNHRKDLASRLSAVLIESAAGHGPKYWRTLEELADSDEFRRMMRDEFPAQASEWSDALSRRQFLTLMSASLALAGLSGCSVRPAPAGKIVPYVRAPEELVPGRPLFYATAMTLGGTGVGLLVESHEGRPTKVEGNPEHPASLGATDHYHQASVLGLYDPDRSKTVTHLGQTRTWDNARTALRGRLAEHQGRRGAGLRVLSETVVSPTLGRQLEDLLRALPEARWHQYEPLHRDAAYRGAVMAFGDTVNTYYDLRKADVVVSLDADFLSCGPGSIRRVADFMSRRRVRTGTGDAGQAWMNRLYVVETGVSQTGAKADHRLTLLASAVEGLARGLAARLGVEVTGGSGAERWIAAVAGDLERHRGRSLVVAGDRQPAVVHLLAHVLNDRLGNVGQTVLHTNPIEARPVEQTESLRELAENMDRGRVQTLLILGGNPVLTGPADFHFLERMQKVPFRAHLGLYQDETARQCHWHMPEAHYLEAWSDTRAFDGTASIAQPLIEPLYAGRSAHELLAALIGPEAMPGYEVVRRQWREHWQAAGSQGNFEDFWQRAVHDGIVPDTRSPTGAATLKEGWQEELRAMSVPAGRGAGGYEIVFQQDHSLYDGRFANNSWLQELPHPITRLTWDNAALMSSKTAHKLGVGLGEYAHGGEHGGYRVPVLELHLQGRVVHAPAWIVSGHADDSITVSLGYGRAYVGKVGGVGESRVGFNAYEIRTSDHPWFAPGLEVVKTSRRHALACTQAHHLMENRDVVRAGTLAQYHDKPAFAAEREELTRDDNEGGRRPLTMYAPHPYPGHRWGMAIDLTTCTGCSACVVACQAENNIPVVGKDQVAAGREMHWLRVDRYVRGPADAPTGFYFQPVPCMHCENAPCEYVCPTVATVHSADGLNDMIYQRCVGTRFCSNNCPYKVRRFNFFFYADYATQSIRQQYNPDVTVRSRGVMEKCTYCVQRIRKAEIDAQKDDRDVADGEILTACQAACPAQAIVFGDINDAESAVKKWKDTPLNYGLLADLNTEPRTTYLAALRNPNPELTTD
jgi:molybdopterin-containing oxidoreductase family iron-sulfur binding subunit